MTSKMSKPSGESRGKPAAYARPTPKVSRIKTAKQYTAAERAAFLSARPDLTSK